MTEIAVHCAAMQDWRGHLAKEKCGVVIFALERGDLYQRRLTAYQKRDNLPKLPIATKRGIINLLDHNSVKTIVSIVREAEQHMGCTVGLIIIDTYSKSVATGDEDKAMVQNRAAANLRGVMSEIDIHVATVGHTGKDEGRGERGSNARLGDIDVQIQISVNGKIRTAKVIAANDQPEREIAKFTTEMVELDVDEDGEVVEVALVSGDAVTSGSEDDEIELSRTNRRAMDLLIDTINEEGQLPPSHPRYSHAVKVVTVEAWQTMCERGGLSSAPKKKSRDRAFQRAKDELQDLRRIGYFDGLVWVAYHEQ
jgi:hypothetical protein